MSKKRASADDTDDADGADAKKDKKKKSNLLPAIIICVGLLGGGYFMGGKGGGEASAEAAKEKEKEEEVLPGEIVAMEAMTLNLADGRYLRLGVAVELVEGVPGKEWEKHGEPSKYQDLIIEQVGALSAADLLAAGGREHLKEILHEGGMELFEEEFYEVFLTEFIVQ